MFIEFMEVMLIVIAVFAFLAIYALSVLFNLGMLVAYFQRATPFHTLTRSIARDRTAANAIAWLGPIVTPLVILVVSFPKYGLKFGSEEDKKWKELAIEDAEERGMINLHQSMPSEVKENFLVPSNRVPGKCISIWKTPSGWGNRSRPPELKIKSSGRHIQNIASVGYRVTNS